MTPHPGAECWLVDLDGVVWLTDEPIAGSKEALRALRGSGHRVAYFTNNSFSTRTEMFAKFKRHGIDLDPEDLLSSAQAAARLVDAEAMVTVLGGDGITEALAARRIDAISLDSLKDTRVDAVVVGLDRGLTFERLRMACEAIHRGAQFIATNDDATYPTANGLWPGAGAVVAAVSYSTGTTPVVAGKPHPPAVRLVTEVLGEVAVVVGDRPDTDGKLAQGLGARFGLVRSGVTSKDAVVDPEPDLGASDLASLVASVLGLTREQIVRGSGVD